MNNDINEVYGDPAAVCRAFHIAINLMFALYFIQHGMHQTAQHALACSWTNDEIISKGIDFLNVEQDNILAFLVLQIIDDISGYFDGTGFWQGSPLKSNARILTWIDSVI